MSRKSDIFVGYYINHDPNPIEFNVIIRGQILHIKILPGSISYAFQNNPVPIINLYDEDPIIQVISGNLNELIPIYSYFNFKERDFLLFHSPTHICLSNNPCLVFQSGKAHIQSKQKITDFSHLISMEQLSQ